MADENLLSIDLEEKPTEITETSEDIEKPTESCLSRQLEEDKNILEVYTVNENADKHNKEILGDMHAELQISPMALEAVLTSSAEHDSLMSDDDTPKVLTTLETVKKMNPPEEVTPIAETPREDKSKPKEPEVKETKKDTGNVKLNIENDSNEDESLKMTEIARKQLESLNKLPKVPRIKIKPTKPKITSDESVPEMKPLSHKQSELYVQVLNDKGETSVKLPCHILGRSKEHPELDPLSNGRNAAKPRQGVKLPIVSLSSSILSKKEVDQAINDKIKSKPKPKLPGNFQIIEHRILNLTEQLPISKADSCKSGGIEIPQELILGQEITLSNTIDCDNIEPEENNQDLIAILEGEDDENDDIKIEEYITDGTVSEYHIVLNDDPSEKETNVHIQKIDYDKELEREIALRQMMNLPKTKGKKKTKTPEQPPIKKAIKKIVTTELVDSLVEDWSDTEIKSEETEIIEPIKDQIESTIVAPVTIVQPKNKRKISVIPTIAATSKEDEQPVKTPIEVQPPFKRTRIIKKKIIWDPDAPETQFSYASLIQNTSAKKAVVKKTVPTVKPELVNKTDATANVTILNNKRLSDGSVSPQSIKKKKISEIDKLLGDEGAIKMIYSLERENNNADVPEIDTEIESDLVDMSKKKKDLASKTKVIRNVVMKQSNTNLLAPTTPRARIKREVTSPKILNVKKEMTKKKGVGPKNATNESWDYVYKQRGGDDSMIIRRRSNSSYSSTSPRRLSLDQSMNTTDSEANTSVGEAICKKLKGKTFEFAKPNVRKEIRTGESSTSLGRHSIINDLKEKYGKVLAKTGVEIVSTGTRRSTRSIESKITSPVKSIKIVEVKPKTKPIEVKEVVLTKHQNFVQVNLTYGSGKLSNFITVQCLRELIAALKSLENDDTCKAVLITSDSKNSNGLDFTSLIQNNMEKRKNAANELADIVYNFLTTLISFEKPIVAGVHGILSGLGVTILPLFDMIISDGSATFETHFVKIGQIPEGYTFLLESNKVKRSAITELFLLCQTLTSVKALENGLITHIVKQSDFQQELLKLTSLIATYSTQAIKAMKTQQRNIFNDKFVTTQTTTSSSASSLSTIIIDEKNCLVQNWISNECQEKFKKYLTTEKW